MTPTPYDPSDYDGDDGTRPMSKKPENETEGWMNAIHQAAEDARNRPAASPAPQHDPATVAPLLAVRPTMQIMEDTPDEVLELCDQFRAALSACSDRVKALEVLDDINRGTIDRQKARLTALEAECARLRNGVPSEGRLHIRIYHRSASYAAYLKARFPNNPGVSDGSVGSFEFEGHRWRYCYTDFDDTGEYDLLERPDPDSVRAGREGGT